MFRFLIGLLFSLALVGCKKDIEVKIDESDVLAVYAGDGPKFIEFEATMGESFTTIDDEKKSEVEAIAAVLQEYFPDSEIDIEYGSNEYEIEVEGEVAMAQSPTGIQTPWYISIDASLGLPQVSMAKTTFHADFSEEIEDINILADVNDYAAVTFKLKSGSGVLIAGGAVVDGEPLGGLSLLPISGPRTTVKFEGDHWKKGPPGFVFIPDEGLENGGG